MEVREIHVRAGGTVPHPSRSFENSKVEVEFVVTVEPDENVEEIIELYGEKASALSTALHERVQSERG